MIAYEFYQRDAIKGFQLIGRLPEKRRNSQRITQDSIINLLRRAKKCDTDISDMFLLRVIIDERTGKVVRTNPSF